MQKDKKTIKIFVSNRIDLDSTAVENPIYIPVRCGAIYDKRSNVSMIGDDTGDNISEKRESFCEFTVQYWAWKNVDADYYGLCHYRRFLSFSDKHFRTDEFEMVRDSELCHSSMEKYGLLDEEKICNTIESYDALIAEGAPVAKRILVGGRAKTVQELWSAYDNVFFERKYREMLFSIIDQYAPEYSCSARNYFKSGNHYGYNCFVLNKELFNKLCEFQFPVLFKFEELIDMSNYSATMKRTIGFLGEMLYGVFVYHIKASCNYKIKENQLVFFQNTKPSKSLCEKLFRFLDMKLFESLRKILNPVFPLGSQAREKMKVIYRGMKNAKK